jgi:hypothetical protein
MVVVVVVVVVVCVCVCVMGGDRDVVVDERGKGDDYYLRN